MRKGELAGSFLPSFSRSLHLPSMAVRRSSPNSRWSLVDMLVSTSSASTPSLSMAHYGCRVSRLLLVADSPLLPSISSAFLRQPGSPTPTPAARSSSVTTATSINPALPLPLTPPLRNPPTPASASRRSSRGKRPKEARSPRSRCTRTSGCPSLSRRPGRARGRGREGRSKNARRSLGLGERKS